MKDRPAYDSRDNNPCDVVRRLVGTLKLTCPTLTKINGMDIETGSPLELLACIRAVELGRAALRRAQRPGLPIMNSIATAVTDTAKIAASEFGLRDSDCWVIGFSAEFKVKFARMNEVAYILSRGGQLLG